MRLLASRWWRWLRGAGPLEILPPRPLPAVAAWLLALALTWGVELFPVPGAQAPVPTNLILALGGEALLVVLVLLVARRSRLLPQALQAAGLLAGLRNLVLAPVLALLLAADASAGPGTILALFLPLALATVLVMAWLVRRYLVLWRQALGVGAVAAGAALLAMAVALLLVESALARIV